MTRGLLLVLSAVLLPSWAWGRGAAGVQSSLHEMVQMAASSQVTLFRMGVYQQEVLPAYQAFVSRGERGPLQALLQRARPLALATRSKASQAELDRLSRSIHLDRLGLRPADGLTIREAAERTSELLSPAEPGVLTRGEIDLALADLAASPNKPAARAGPELRWLFLGLVDLLCIPWEQKVVPVQEVSRSMLGEYLEGRSEWIADHLVNGFPGGPEIQVPEWGPMPSLLPEEVDRLSDELAVVGPPEGPAILVRQFERLKAIVSTALERPEFTLVHWHRPGPP